MANSLQVIAPPGAYCVIDDGPAISTVPTAAAGVPPPTNTGAQDMNTNPFGNGTIPDFLNTSTKISFSPDASPMYFKNPS